MIETFVLLYGVALVAGSWVMLKGIDEAPLGYEDEDGFHYAPARVERAPRAPATDDLEEAE